MGGDPRLGKIYKLWCDEKDPVYIGYTTQSLEERFAQHQEGIRLRLNKTYEALSKYSGIKISLIEEYGCATWGELEAREAYWIQLYGDELVQKRGNKKRVKAKRHD